MILNELEQRCVHQLAKWYEVQIGGFFTIDALATELGLTTDECEPLLGTMEHAGCLTNVRVADGLPYQAFNITPLAVQISRELSEQIEQSKSPRDKVEVVNSWARRNPVVAFLLIAFAILTFVITFINQGWDLLVKLGCVKPAVQQIEQKENKSDLPNKEPINLRR